MRHFVADLALLALITVSCSTKEQADLIVTNANIYTVNDNFETAPLFFQRGERFLKQIRGVNLKSNDLFKILPDFMTMIKQIHTLKHLKKFRWELRQNLTPAEAFLWAQLKSRQLGW